MVTGEKREKKTTLSVSKAAKRSAVLLNHSVSRQTSLPSHPKKSLKRADANSLPN